MGFKDIERWNISKMNNIIPRSNCAKKETTHVPQWFTFEFMEGVTTTLPVQWSAESRKFVFKIRRRLIIHNLMYLQNAPTPTATR